MIRVIRLIVFGCALSVTACHSYRESAAPTPQEAIGVNQKLRLTMRDGAVIELQNASARGDSIVGIEVSTGDVKSVAADKVKKVEREELNGTRTTVLALGATAATVAVIWAALTLLAISLYLAILKSGSN